MRYVSAEKNVNFQVKHAQILCMTGAWFPTLAIEKSVLLRIQNNPFTVMLPHPAL